MVAHAQPPDLDRRLDLRGELGAPDARVLLAVSAPDEDAAAGRDRQGLAGRDGVGVVGGVGNVIVFLPQITVLFGLLYLLEDLGYMARAAFVVDRVMGWVGLQGRSFVPLLSCYACAVPGICCGAST